jgi:hypothetical protein
MRRHGATVAGTSLRELTFRTVFCSDNCKLLSQAMAMGHVDSLSPGEAKLTSAHQLRPPSTNRAWDYWVRQVEKVGLMPAGYGAAKSGTKSGTKSGAKSGAKTAAAKTAGRTISKTGAVFAARTRAHSAKRRAPKSAGKGVRQAVSAKHR